MFKYKYRLHIVMAFLSIFSVKMMISAAPFFVEMDKDTMKSIIMQLEQEHHSESDLTKDSLKLIDYKLSHQNGHEPYIPLLQNFGIKNDFIDHFKRYVDPYHPSVPTPPPNSAAYLQS